MQNVGFSHDAAHIYYRAVARSVSRLPRKQRSRDRLPRPAHSFAQNRSSADSRSCQLLAKEWVLNTGKLHPGCLPRNSVVK